MQDQIIVVNGQISGMLYGLMAKKISCGMCGKIVDTIRYIPKEGRGPMIELVGVQELKLMSIHLRYQILLLRGTQY